MGLALVGLMVAEAVRQAAELPEKQGGDQQKQA
jgi:hypothetical protein